MHEIKGIFNKWAGVLTKPKATFRKEGKSRKINEAVVHLLVAGFLASLIAVFLTLNFAALLIVPATFVLVWAVYAVVFYVFAKLFEGRANLVQHAHAIALVNAPFGLIAAITDQIPTIGNIVSLLVGLYSLYVLTIALRETHRFSTGRAVLTWLVPVFLLFLIVFALVLLGFFAGLA